MYNPLGQCQKAIGLLADKVRPIFRYDSRNSSPPTKELFFGLPPRILGGHRQGGTARWG
jgi:hypothetical protein